jgi:circadian clock protein KaiC
VRRIRTGIDELDVVLGGGLPLGSLTLIAGGAGAGKTILAQQICFANATGEHRARYYTMLAEPHEKLIEHLEQFEFFDRSKLGRQVEFIHLPSLLEHHAEKTPLERTRALEALVDEVAGASIRDQPAVIVIDSIRALHDFAPREGFRGIAYELASRIRHSNAVLLFVGEYRADEVTSAAEFAVADAIIFLANEPFGRFDQRSLRVVKMRGSDYLTGTHTFKIGPTGCQVFPRFESLAPRRERWSGPRIPIGIPRLDAMIGGGLPPATATLVAGPSGAGKTVLALHFIASGIERDERSLFLSFQQNEAQLIQRSDAFGWDFPAAIRSGRLEIRHLEPIELSLDMIGAELHAAARKDKPVRRVVVDSLAELEPAARGTDRFPDYLSALVGLFASIGATTVLTSETTAFFGPAFELPHGLAFVADNVILLRYAELASEIRRVLAIVKMRDGDHIKSLVEIEIGANGMEIGDKLEGVTGILGGTPTTVTAAPTHRRG